MDYRFSGVVTVWLLTIIHISTQDVSVSASFTKAVKEKDFSDWVSRVGARVRTKNVTATGASELVGSSLQVGNVITVAPSGAQFSSVQDAVDAASGSARTIIQIAAGTYQEQVTVSKSFITFQGAGAGTTYIVWHDTAANTGNLAETASVTILGDNFIAHDVSFSNSAPSPPVGSKNRQAVALRVAADQAAFYACSFHGFQDTLFDDEGKHYFEGCYIEGSVDFICGNGQSLYKNCELNALARKTESFTAQKRASPSDNSGFSFVGGKVTGAGKAYLGRAWGKYARTVFAYTYMDAVILPVGWYNWGDSSRESTVYYGQYLCTGPGADESGRVSWSHELTAAEAAPFLGLSFIDGESWVAA